MSSRSPLLFFLPILLTFLPDPTKAFHPGASCTVATQATDCGTAVFPLPSSYLECDEETLVCRCQEPVISYFDHFDGRCYREVGAQCVRTAQCTPNTACSTGSTPNVCECPAPYHVTPYMKCVLHENETCLLHKQCDRDAYMICRGVLTRTCRCNGTSVDDAIYNPAMDQCILVNGADCEDRGDYRPQPCPLVGSKCVNGKCDCVPPFTENALGECRLDIGDECTMDIECNQDKFLVCGVGSGKCECQSGSSYHGVKETCVIMANQNCNSAVGTGQECVDFAKCELVESGTGAGNYFCLCRPGTSVSEGYQCVLKYGEVCTGDPSDPPCNAEIYEKCDPGTHKCVCDNLLDTWYDTDTKTCFLLEGASCSPDNLNPNRQPCAPNSYCLPTVGSPLGGKCSCNDNMLPDPGRRCYLSLSQVCNPLNDLCDKNSFLYCNPKSIRCECADPEETILEEHSLQCKRKADSSCSPYPGGQGCVQFSSCRQFESKYQCLCAVELSSNSAGKCVRQYGSFCSSTADGTCDLEGYQTCIYGFCDCIDPPQMEYDPTDHKCYLKMYGICSGASESIPCHGDLLCLNGTCQCDSSQGFIDDGQGSCLKGFGSICDDTEDTEEDDCNVNSYLECRNGTCQCHLNYSPIEKPDGTPFCLGNNGANCRNHSECNVDGALTCQGSWCACHVLDEMEYDPVEKQCFGILNARCHLREEMPPDAEVLLKCNPKFICRAAIDTIDPIGRCSCVRSNSTGLGGNRQCGRGARVQGDFDILNVVAFILILVSIFLK